MVLTTLLHGDDLVFLQGWELSVGNYVIMLHGVNKMCKRFVNVPFMCKCVNVNFMKTDNRSFEMVEQSKYMGTALTNRNSIQEEIKNRLKLGNACYHSTQNILSFQFAFQKFKD